MSSTNINMDMQSSLLCVDLESFVSIPKNCVSGTYGSSNFSFLMNCHSDFHSGYTSLHSITVTKGSSVTMSLSAFVIIFYLIITILTGVGWYLKAIYMSPMAKDIENILKFLFLIL